MITEIRWIERVEYYNGPAIPGEMAFRAIPKVVRVLQACDGHVWFDIPVVNDINTVTVSR